MTFPINVTNSGAVLLGPDVACDGFHRERLARVQTHVHMDHMYGFESSKGLQQILLSEGTRRLLCSEHNADLPYRSNIKPLSPGERFDVGRSAVELVPSGHMLGAVQVVVELADGARLGYSGDFQWPLEQVPELDAVVVDSTYGNPNSVREFSQGQCEECFLDLVMSNINRRPVHIVAHRGTLQRALQVLAGVLDCPVIGSDRIAQRALVYRSFGYPIDPIVSIDSAGGKEALGTERYVRLYGTGDSRPVDIGLGMMIKLSAFFSRPDSPVMEYSSRAYGVALSNHADFDGTLEYVKATGAGYVVTDNSRGGKAVELATELRNRLGIIAQPSRSEPHLEWGY